MISTPSFIFRPFTIFLFLCTSLLPASLWGQDDTGETARHLVRDDKGMLMSSEHRIFDEQGQLAAMIVYTYDEDGVVETRSIEGYDGKGHLMRRMIYSSDEVLLLEEKYKYDRRGNLVKRVQTTYDDSTVRTWTETRRYTYNEDGTVSHCRYYRDGALYFEQ